MTRVLFSACMLALGATVTLSSWCAAENATTINILSPHNGANVAETFDMKYEILNGTGRQPRARLFRWRVSEGI